LLSKSSDSAGTGEPGSAAAEPGTESDPQVAPAGNERDQLGRFTAGNTGHLIYGVHSKRRSLLLAPIRQEMRSAILADLGHTNADAPRTLSIVIDQLAEARLIAQSYFEFLAASGGPISTKGRQRRCVEGFLKASMTVAKFASMIGLERRTKRPQLTPAEWLQGLEPNNDDNNNSDNGKGATDDAAATEDESAE
jgi:hypothetical protein